MNSRLDFMDAFLEIQDHPDGVVWIAGPVGTVAIEDGTARCTVELLPFRWHGVLSRAKDLSPRTAELLIAAQGSEIVRLGVTLHGKASFAGSPIGSPMLSEDTIPSRESLTLKERADAWELHDTAGTVRVRIPRNTPTRDEWIEDPGEYQDHLRLEFYPDGEQCLRLQECDRFFYGKFDSLPLAFLESQGAGVASFISFAAEAKGRYYGTGERFNRFALNGTTVDYVNTDGLGTNSSKSYKNIPFYVSDSGPGVFFHTSAHMRTSFADISARSVQTRVEEPTIDCFLIGGNGVERRVANYQSLTGTPPALPLWSYGVWMSRMSYFSAVEVEDVADRLRAEKFPCDVLHVDTGWFEQDWVCDWRFSKRRFPRAKEFMERLRKKGFRITLWQTPNIGRTNPLYQMATENGYLAPAEGGKGEQFLSDFSGQDFGGQIDLTNPEAEAWYKEMLVEVLNHGVAAIKADFGERVLKNARYAQLPAAQLHNLYALLYQRAVWQATVESGTVEPLIWARAGWAGCQRYPVHWAGDSASSWDGMRATLRGGLQLGLSGFTYWSHDVPGFHGVPYFMHSKPSAALYLRWTQFGALSSHMRYHGCFPREPWEYPEIADGIRRWWRLRYALIPYIVAEAEKCRKSGRPLIAPLFLDHPDEELLYHLDDQYLFGRSVLVAPIMNGEGSREVYLPEGQWVDFWSGATYQGKRWLRRSHPLETLPLFVRQGAELPVYPEPVTSTNEMILDRRQMMSFDDTYRGVNESPLEFIGFNPQFEEE